MPLLLVVALLALGWIGTPEHRRPRLDASLAWAGELRERVEALLEREPPPPPVEFWIEPAALASATRDDWGWPAWSDERWAAELGDVLARTRAFRVGDVHAVAVLRAELKALSFVRAVPTLDVDEEFGLALALELRRPVACLPSGASFLTVDAEGVVLSGTWPTPVRIAGVPLPVIGPMSEANGLFAYARPGDWLQEPEHVDALDVALSLAAHLDAPTRRGLGRLVIDASAARRASVEEPGVRLLLEERRLVLFGRGPALGEAGELAVAYKWDAVRRALAPLDDPSDPFDWDVVDVRWDEPEFVPRPPALARLDADASDAARPY